LPSKLDTADTMLLEYKKGQRTSFKGIVIKGRPIINHYMSESGIFKYIIPFLVAADANPNHLTLETSPLYEAVKSGDIESVKLLLFHGADVRKKPPSKKNVLSLAAELQYLDIVRMLLNTNQYSVREIDQAITYVDELSNDIGITRMQPIKEVLIHKLQELTSQTALEE